jgi:hypothetical protein
VQPLILDGEVQQGQHPVGVTDAVGRISPDLHGSHPGGHVSMTDPVDRLPNCCRTRTDHAEA